MDRQEAYELWLEQQYDLMGFVGNIDFDEFYAGLNEEDL